MTRGITQLQAVVAALRERPFLLGDHENAKEDSEQGKFLCQIYGKPIINNSLTGALATLRIRKIVDTLDGKWFLAKNWEEELRKYEEAKRRNDNKVVTLLLRELVGTKEDMKENDRILEEIGDAIYPYASSADKREAGCRRRAEEMHGAKAMFTGEVEPRAWEASHSIEVRSSRTLVDNSPYNILLLRNDIHAMRDGSCGSDKYPIEIHSASDEGLMLVVNTSDPLYRGLDGLIHRFDAHIVREVQKRVIIGNIARGIEQNIPEWFALWQHQRKAPMSYSPGPSEDLVAELGD